ncbi:PH domain-containing protein [Pseudonocardia dioxanivorans]|uniref:PH domain-containing protein n=1 Tax=Pseudonocardia dioxanivorans TaxID=240495 RepID=UPI0018F89B3F|nr:PH domain-containing protein [Pseudonocardia dioxanivorans]
MSGRQVGTGATVRGTGDDGPDAAAPRPAGEQVTGEQVILRPRRVLWLAWIGAVAVFVLFVVIAVVLRTADTGVYFRLADQISMVVLGLLIAGGLLLLARPRVRADARDIEVRNILLTRRVPWTEVVGVAFPDGASWARLDLPDYEYFPILAVQAADRQYAVAGIRRLRALHAAALQAAAHQAVGERPAGSGAGAAERPPAAGGGLAGPQLTPDTGTTPTGTTPTGTTPAGTTPSAGTAGAGTPDAATPGATPRHDDTPGSAGDSGA